MSAPILYSSLSFSHWIVNSIWAVGNNIEWNRSNKMNLICKYHGNRSASSILTFQMQQTRSDVILIDINIGRIENDSHAEQRRANSKQRILLISRWSSILLAVSKNQIFEKKKWASCLQTALIAKLVFYHVVYNVISKNIWRKNEWYQMKNHRKKKPHTPFAMCVCVWCVNACISALMLHQIFDIVLNTNTRYCFLNIYFTRMRVNISKRINEWEKMLKIK